MNRPIHWQEAGRSLLATKQRSLLALIGIVIGVASVIAMVTIGRIVQEESLRQFMALGTDLLTIQRGFEEGPSQRRKAHLGLVQAAGLAQACPAIVAVAASVQGPSAVSLRGRALGQVSVLGVTGAFAPLQKLKLAQGRFLTDLDAQSHYVVVGAGVAEQLRQRQVDPVLGGQVRIQDNFFTILGVLEPVPTGGMRRFDPNDSLFAHATTVMRRGHLADLSDITAKVRPGQSVDAASQQVQRYFEHLDPPVPVRVTSPQEMIAQMQQQMRMFTLLLGAIGSISLLVGGVGVMNVMLVAVTERRREIGVRRALGARQGDIRKQFLVESVVLSLVGGVLGVALGVGVAWAVAYIAGWHFMWSGPAIALGVLVSTAVGGSVRISVCRAGK
jgi:putative ABC transport system permease protein